MFRHALRLPFRVMGIPISLDRSFLLVLPLFAYLIGSQIPAYVGLFRSVGLRIDPAALEGGARPYLVGLAGAVGLFLSVLLHELGHALVARLYRVRTREITLWFLGGVAQFDDLPRQRGAEAIVAIAGPLTSLALALLTALAWPWAAGSAGALFLLSYLTITNTGLALFNLLPALPLDGGRVLRSLLALAMPRVRATRVAGAVSAVVAILLGIYGLVTFSLFLVAIAFFVYNAGRAETQAAIVGDVFEGKTVADLMTREPVTVFPDMLLSQFAQLIFFRRHTGYPVVDDDARVLGYARVQDTHSAPDHATVADIMIPAVTIPPDANALTALQRIGDGELGRLVVVDASGKLLGMLSKTDLIALIRQRTEAAGAGAKLPRDGAGGRGAT